MKNLQAEFGDLESARPPSRGSEHSESSALVKASVERVFDYVDDHTRLTSHMSRSSWMMGGGKMETHVDEGMGQRVGSHIRLSGRVFGISLFVEEVVTELQRPLRKVWRTIGKPRLLVIDEYEMGFDLFPQRDGSLFRVFINYSAPPGSRLLHWLQRILARFYANWCVRQMVQDAIKHFQTEA